MFDAEELRGAGAVDAVDGVANATLETTQTLQQPPSALQITVCWGDNVLSVKELLPGSSFVVAESDDGGDVDFVAPAQCLGSGRWTLLRSIGGQCVVTIPPRADGTCLRGNGRSVAFDELRAAAPFNEDGHEFVVSQGDVVSVELGGLVFRVAAIVPERRLPRTFGRDMKTITAYFGASLLSTAGLMASIAYFVPPLGVNDGEGVDADRLYLIQQFLDASAMREEEQKETPQAADDAPAGGKEGSRAAGDEGATGKPEVAKSRNKLAIAGPSNNPKPEPMKVSEAVSFGMIGLLAGGTTRDGIDSPWARDEALGSDPLSANGAMWGDTLGENHGSNGLGLLGLAEGGGGRYQGIGLGDVGTVGTLGNCVGANCLDNGFGRGVGRNSGSYRPKSRGAMRMATPVISGRLPPQTIQRIVRQNFGRYRQCYERGLSRNPNLEGRVSVRFLISSNGSVASVANGGSSLPDQAVVSCVVSAFYGLSFPKPEHGSVSVTYPIMFSPG